MKKKKYKAYLRLNLVSLFFVGVSIISMTFAWFAYSGLATVQTEIDVKTWAIEFKKGEEVVSNDIVISLADIYPGMEPSYESVRILNKGDSDASISYTIESASILDDSLDGKVLSNEEMNDKLSHDYPFNINISLSKNTALAHGDFSVFDVSISWPLDSGNDELDSTWGSLAYDFQQNEAKMLSEDSNYHKRSAVRIAISVKAVQLLEAEDENDPLYPQGQLILYDVENNKSCDAISDTCIMTHVIDSHSTLGDKEVHLLPELLSSYNDGSATQYNALLPNWNVTMRPLKVEDLLHVISSDVVNSRIVREGLSSQVLGYTGNSERLNGIINNTIEKNGYFRFENNKFNYLSVNKCIWIDSEYGSDKRFALSKINDTQSKIYGEDVNSSCSVVPVITASKSHITF